MNPNRLAVQRKEGLEKVEFQETTGINDPVEILLTKESNGFAVWDKQSTGEFKLTSYLQTTRSLALKAAALRVGAVQNSYKERLKRVQS